MQVSGDKKSKGQFLGKLFKRRTINSLFVIFFITLIFIHLFSVMPWWCYGLLIFGWFLITAFGSFFVRWNYHLESLHHHNGLSKNWVSISFDDGPHPDFTPRVLKLLEQYNAKATFFCIGQKMEKHPHIVEQILAEGHSIGNHTYSHSKSFGFFGKEKVKEELSRTESFFQKLTGLQMKLYRPAFGVTNPQIEKAVEGLGLYSIGWSVRSLDTTSRSETSILNRITSKVRRGDIILLHDTSEKSVAVLERLLVFLEKKNWESVTVERLLEIEAYV